MFRSILASIAAVGLIASAATAASLTPEEKLAKVLDGRVAGDPVDCISLRNIRSSQIFDKTAILYEGNDGIYYVNRPDGGAPFLDSSSILVTQTSLSQLCSVDIVRLVDQGTHMERGAVNLGKFVPYKKAPKAQ